MKIPTNEEIAAAIAPTDETVPDVTCTPEVTLDSTPLQSALRDALRRLHAERSTVAELASVIAQERAAFDTSILGQTDALRNGRDRIARLEEEIRASVLVLHSTTGERKPAPGTEVKTFAIYEIDADAGLAWAREKKLCLIPEALDVPAIKKLATVQALPFVKVSQERRALVASDLGQVLAAEVPS